MTTAATEQGPGGRSGGRPLGASPQLSLDERAEVERLVDGLRDLHPRQRDGDVLAEAYGLVHARLTELDPDRCRGVLAELEGQA